MKDIIDFISRVFVSMLFLLNGYFKIINFDGTIEWMDSYEVPGILLTPAIILEIAAPVLIILGYKTKIAASCLAGFCITTALVFHLDFSNQIQITSFLKNIALAGGFLIIAINGAKKFSLDYKKIK